MGDNLPEVGEIVAYHAPEGGTVMAVVVVVTFWDLVDLKLADGTVVHNVRRSILTPHGTVVVERGRFDRVGADD